MSNVPYLTGLTTELEQTPLGLAKVGDRIYFSTSGFTCFGRAWRRGDEHVLTAADLGNTINKLGQSWLDAELARPDGRVGLGAFPSDESILVPGSVEHAEERERQRRLAHARPENERAAALAKVRSDFGTETTSRTINGAPDPSTRAAREQDARIRQSAVQQVTRYAPGEREVQLCR